MKLSESLEHLQRQLARSWQNAEHSGDASRLTYNEYEYLRAVDTLDGNTLSASPDDLADGHHVSEVASEMRVRKASASAMVQKLERRGFVHRVPCRYDARAQHIMLTDEGRTLLAKAHAVYTRTAARMKKLLEPEQYRELERALAKVAKL